MQKRSSFVVHFYVNHKWLIDEPVMARDLWHAHKMAAYIAATVARLNGHDPVIEQVSWEIQSPVAVQAGGVNANQATVALRC